METKYIEIRDHATCIAAIAVTIDGDDSWLARRSGFSRGRRYVLLTRLGDQRSAYDPYSWGWSAGARTMTIAHLYAIENWDSIPNEGIVDVRRIVGETDADAPSDRTIYD